jgi:hypothetical protein
MTANRQRRTGEERMLGWVGDIERETLDNTVVNTGAGDVKLDSLYSPPKHPPGTVHRTKADAEVAERAHQRS